MAAILHDRRSIFRICAVIAMALACMFGMPHAARAAQRQGTLSLQCTTEHDGAPVVLAGDTYALALVAAADVAWNDGVPSVTFTPAAGFEAFDYSWGSLDADALRAAAHELDEHAQSAGLYTAGTSTANQAGIASFGWLDPGLYLVARVSIAEGNEAYTCDPMVMSVPALEDGALVYRVVAEPKYEWDESPAAPPSEPPAQGSEEPSAPTLDDMLAAWGLPTTGDPAFRLGMGLMLLGGLLAAAGWWHRRHAAALATDAGSAAAAEDDISAGAAPDR